MARKSKQKTIPQIIDNICEMEAYIEYLEDKLKNHWSYDRNKDRNQLIFANMRLKKLKLELDKA